MYGVLTEITPTGRINMEAVRFEGCPDKYGRYEVMRGSYDRDDLIRQFEREMSRRYRTLVPSFNSHTPIYPSIKEVIFNNPATVVIWADGTKTVVKCQEGDTYNEELGLAMCISKKFFGNKGNFNEVFKKWIKEDPFSNGIPKVGTRIEIIDAKNGALGANGKIGVVTDRPSCAGMLSIDPGYNVDTGNGRIWRINPNAEIKILN